MSAKDFYVRKLADAFLAGTWEVKALARRGAETCGARLRWLSRLARRALKAFPERPADPADLLRFLSADRRLALALGRHRSRGDELAGRSFCPAPVMAPSPWPVPPLPTLDALAEWLGVGPGELDWFCDVRRLERHAEAGPLRHYTYRWRPGRH